MMEAAISREPAGLVPWGASIARGHHCCEPRPRDQGCGNPGTQHTDNEHSNLSLTSSSIGWLSLTLAEFIAITSEQGCRIVRRVAA